MEQEYLAVAGIWNFDVTSGYIHAFNTNNDSLKMFEGYENEANLVFKEEQAEFLKLKSSSV